MYSSEFQSAFTCSICMRYFMDPVTICCGHSFCTPCLSICWEEAQHPPTCPKCKKISHQTSLKTDIVLKTRTYLARRAEASRQPSSAEQLCEAHMRPKNYFCEDVGQLVCVLCSRVRGHRAHGHRAADWTAEEYRQKLLKEMRYLWEKIQDNKRNLAQETSIIKTWMDFVLHRRKMISAEYWRLGQLLYDKEECHLERLEKESEEIFQQLQESEARMSLNGKLLRKLYEDMEEMCRKPDLELIQHFRSMKKRNESVQLHMPQPVNAELGSWPITGLIDMLNRFRVCVSWANKVATCPIPLFEDMRCLYFSPRHLDVTCNLTRSTGLFAWGERPFPFGRYYWEVDVGDCYNWAIGFCNDSWTMKTDMLVNSEGLFVLFCVTWDSGSRLFTSSPVLPLYIERPLGHIGVFLDYEFGKISFFNVAKSSPICSLLSCSFSSPLRPFLFFGPK